MQLLATSTWTNCSRLRLSSISLDNVHIINSCSIMYHFKINQVRIGGKSRNLPTPCPLNSPIRITPSKLHQNFWNKKKNDKLNHAEKVWHVQLIQNSSWVWYDSYTINLTLQSHHTVTLKIALITLATFLVDRQFSAGCYLITVSNSGLFFGHGFTTGFPTSFSLFNESSANTAEKPPVTLNSDLTLTQKTSR